MKRIFGAKTRLLISILALVSILVVGGTLAFLYATDGSLTNSFKLAQLNTEIDENLNSGKQVWVKNLGESPAYVRVKILVSGVDPDAVKIVTSEPEAKPEDNIVLLYMPNFNQWKRTTDTGDTYGGYNDDFFYYLKELNGKAENVTADNAPTTSNLLEAVYAGDGVDVKNLTVTVVHESVLAQPSGLNTASAIANLFTKKAN